MRIQEGAGRYRIRTASICFDRAEKTLDEVGKIMALNAAGLSGLGDVAAMDGQLLPEIV